MDRSRFRGPSPENYVSHTPSFRVDVKELKKIKVAIKRNIPGVETPQQEIDRTLDRPEEITIYRCHGEGNRPIFARQDIVVNKEEPEHRTVSTQSPRRSPRRTPKRNRSSPSPRRDGRRSSTGARSPRRNSNRRDSPRRDTGRAFRNRSRSHESSRRRRSSRSRSRSPRRDFARRRNTRSPDERDRRRHERNDYRHLDRNGRRERSRSPRYARSPGRRRSISRPPHMAPLDPNTLGAIPLILPPDLNFYGPDDTIWFPAPLRPPMMVPRGILPPRGMYRAPMYGVRPPLPPRPPYVPLQRPPQFGQIRAALNRPRVPQ